jgi:type I restriction enzyme R subunit
MPTKEATARIKINKLLEAAGWRFFPDGAKPANIRMETTVTIKSSDLDQLGEDFEKTGKVYVDFLLLDSRGFPLIVLEAKSEEKNPLAGKEQARRYARSQNCRFVILSNSNLHYFWDLEHGNPNLITSFPTTESVLGYKQVTPNPGQLINQVVEDDYIVLTQRPGYKSEAAWINEAERPGYIQANKLRFLRPYQLKAIHALQSAVKEGKDWFLFEMATGTGKTLTAAAVIKLFLRSGNVRRVLFLVDRLELEDQAKKSVCRADVG